MGGFLSGLLNAFGSQVGNKITESLSSSVLGKNTAEEKPIIHPPINFPPSAVNTTQVEIHYLLNI